MVERASPAQQRKALELAHTYAKAGIGFVPVPVADNAEFDKLVQQAIKRLAELEREASAAESSAAEAKPLTRCAAARDGDCSHAQCPQRIDGARAIGRHCPLDNQNEED